MTVAIEVCWVNMRAVHAATFCDVGVQVQPAYLQCQQAEAKDCHQFGRRATHPVMITHRFLSDH